MKFVPANADGVMGHDVTLGSERSSIVRCAFWLDDGGSEVVFTLVRRPDTSDERFAADAGLVEKDLHTLKSILEG